MQRSPTHLGQVVLGNFRLIRLLGGGSFANAYLAEQVGTDRKAVVKIAHGHLLRGDGGEMVRSRFASEVRAATRVTHPHLVTVYMAGETDDGVPALAMEHLEGETLGQRLTRGEALTPVELINCFTQLGSALQAVHASQIVHRDVSPENVFLVRTPHGLSVKLLDFGVARLLDRAPSGKHTVGTPFYMAPEQIEGDAQIASDVYAMGALLWWALTGYELFAHIEQFGQLVEILRTQKRAPDPRGVCPTLPERAADLLRSMLDGEAARRPSMTWFLEEWSALAPELKAWKRSQEQRHVVLLMAPGPLTDMVEGALRQGGHEVKRLPGARQSELFGLKDCDAVVLDAEQSGPDPVALARSLAEVLPHAQLHVVSARPFAPVWWSVKTARLALLPEELPGLRDTIEDGAPVSKPPISREYSHLALGEIPELLAGLEEVAEQGDSHGIARHCERIERYAHLVSLRDLGSLARTMRALCDGGALEDPVPFVGEMQLSYQNAFRSLLAAQNS